jgi:hypothetical protein
MFVLKNDLGLFVKITSIDDPSLLLLQVLPLTIFLRLNVAKSSDRRLNLSVDW